MSTKLPTSLIPAIYSWQLHSIVLAARACGYAVAVHGSMQTDLDLVAIPWTRRAVSPKTLAQRVCKDAGLELTEHQKGWKPSMHPHGRMVFTLMFRGSLYVDLSIMPRQKRKPQ